MLIDRGIDMVFSISVHTGIEFWVDHSFVFFYSSRLSGKCEKYIHRYFNDDNERIIDYSMAVVFFFLQIIIDKNIKTKQ